MPVVFESRKKHPDDDSHLTPSQQRFEIAVQEVARQEGVSTEALVREAQNYGIGKSSSMVGLNPSDDPLIAEARRLRLAKEQEEARTRHVPTWPGPTLD